MAAMVMNAGFNATTRKMWKPGRRKDKLSMQALIQELTNNGELVVEFAVRVLLGQDLRLATDWVPLLKAGKIRPRRNGIPVQTKADATVRLRKLRRALGVIPDAPEITMDDRRWAAQLLLGYGWGLPGRMEPGGDPGDRIGSTALAIRAAEIVEEFQPQGAEEEGRLARILAVISAEKRRMPTIVTETGEVISPRDLPPWTP